ncbi:MAG TPA: hypothetical protein VIG99_19080 [Myxococcaceae bacterium]|jgi:hypothetical protein
MGRGEGPVEGEMTILMSELGEAMHGENREKVASAMRRFTVEEVTGPEAFDAGYRLLDAQFGPVNEIERREVLERWQARGSLSAEDAPVRAHYHMLLFREPDGRVAAVRDAFSAVDRESRRVVVLLSHSLVMPEARRTGVAALLRAAPVILARRDAAAAGIAGAKTLLVAEMDPVVPGQSATVVRLLSYAQAGFRVVPPSSAPYAQPDFRDLEALGAEAVPIPMMLVVRQVGAEARAELDWPDLEAILDGLAAIHLHSVQRAQLPEIRRNALRYRPAGDEPPIALLQPRREEDLAPLHRGVVLPHYPPAWR